MGKKAKAKQGPSKKPKQEIPADPLIDPFFMELAVQLKSKKGKKKPRTRKVPAELLPFIESRRLSNLVEALRTHPELYWHQLVARQLTYLRRLHHDEQEWERRLGWSLEVDEHTGAVRRPREARLAHVLSVKLAEAHLGALVPRLRVVLAPAHRKPGQKAGFKNPHPMPGEPWTEWISADILNEDEQALRGAFKAQRHELELKPDKVQDEAKAARIAQLAVKALEKSGAAWWWSDLSEYVEEPVTHPDGSDQRRRTSRGKQRLDPLDIPEIPSTTDLVVRFKPLDLDAAIDNMLNDNMGKAGDDGKPAYMAYAVLGALLKKAPTKIRNTIDNYRRSLRRKKTR